MVNFVSLINGVKNLISSIGISAGISDAGKIPHLDDNGKLNNSFVNNTDLNPYGLRSHYYILDTDFVITPVAGGQSGAYSYWGMQLGGIRGNRIYQNGVGAGVTIPPVLENIQNPDSFCVGIRTQPTNEFYGTLPNNFTVLALYSTNWQTSGSYLDCRNSSFDSIFKVDLEGNLFVKNKEINLITPPSEYFYLYSDFLFNLGDFTSGLSGTGTSITFNNIDTGNHPGIATLSTGTTTTGSTRVGYETSTGQANILLGFAKWKYESCIMIPVLSDITETFSLQSGFTNNNVPTDGVYFRYTHSENTGKWQACTRSNNSTINSIDSGISVVANQWYRQTIIINATGTLATFFIDGIQVASTALSIPVGANRQTGLAVNILKSLGIIARLANIDYINVVARFTTPR
jgi:hypothetical protein